MIPKSGLKNSIEVAYLTLPISDPVLAKPSSGVSYSSQIPVSLTFGELYIAGSASLTFKNISGTYSNTLTLIDNVLSQTFTITTGNVSISPNITSSSHSTLPDDTYNVTLSYTGITTGTLTTTSSNVIIQTSTPSPNLISPTTGTLISASRLTFTYNIPSTPLSGTAVLTLIPGYSYPLTNNVGVNTYTITANLPIDGVYTAKVSYQDQLGNPAASSSSINLTIKSQINVNYVDAVNGSDLTGIGSPLQPYKTIQKAVSNSLNGDSVILKKGTYTETIDFVGKSLFIGSLYDSAVNDTSFITQTILDGSSIGSSALISNSGISTGSYKIYGVTITNVPQRVLGFITNSTMQKCVIKNSGNSGTEMIQLTSNQYIIDCDIYSNKAGTIIFTNRNTNISSYILNTKIHHNNLSLSGGSKCVQFEGPLTMINCQIYKNYYQSAIEMGDNAQSATFKMFFSTITENYGAGLNFAPWSGGYTAYVANNIIANNAVDLNFEDRITGPSIKMYNNLIPNGLNGLSINSFYNLTYTDNYKLSPIFNDTVNYDFSLKANSPGIGYGKFDQSKHIDTVINDYLYNIRPLPNGSNPDVGAFESLYKLPAPTISKNEPGNKNVKLTFSIDSVTNSLDTIKSYKIYRSISSIADNSNITEIYTIVSPSTFTFIDSIGLTNNIKYYYRVKVVYKDNTLSGFSNQVFSTPNIVDTIKNITISNSPNIAKISFFAISNLVLF